MPDITRNYHRGNQQSAEANQSIETSKQAMCNKILAYMRKRGDATSAEAEVDLIMLHQTCSARFAELKADGFIEATGLKRPTQSGRMAAVYRVRDRQVSEPEPPADVVGQYGLFK